jgi:glycine cleavage system H protein
MSETRYTDDHEWARVDEDGIVTVGITDYAQTQLGELVYVELPDVGRQVSKGEDAAVIESVKAAGEVKAPVSGTVAAVNDALTDNPEKVNEDPTGEGWFYTIEMSAPEELESLLDEDAYQELVEGLS